MDFDADELLAIRAVSLGVFDAEIQRLTALKKETDAKLEALGGLQHAQTNIAKAKTMFAEAEHAKQQAAAALTEVREEAQSLLAEATREREKARALVTEAEAGQRGLITARARWDAEFNRLNGDAMKKQQNLRDQERILQERMAAISEKEQSLKERAEKVRQLVGS